MADIAAELAWIRGHAAKQSAENDAADRQRRVEERGERLARCQFCSHARHHGYLIAASIFPVYREHITSTDDAEDAMVVRWCSDESCLCGIPPCGLCGDRSRNRDTGTFTGRCCPACGFEWQESPIA